MHGDVEHPPANEDALLKPGDIYQTTKLEGEEIAREAGQRLGVAVAIVRPTGIYGPRAIARLLKLFRGVVRRTLPDSRQRGEIYYHLTGDRRSRRGFRRCAAHTDPRAANRTYILAGGEVTTLNELVSRIADVAGVKPPRWRLPVWPFWIAGAACEADCGAVLAWSRPSTGGASISIRRAGRSTSRGHEPGTRLRSPGVIARRHRPDPRLVPGTWLDLIS